jgi:hypothetical protein
MNGRPRRAEPLVALFVAATWAAASFGIAGLLAVTLDRDPIEGDVPRFYGIVALALAAVVVWIVVSVRARAARMPWAAGLVAAAAVYFLFLLSGFVLGTALLIEQATSPFVIAAALLGGIAVVATWAAMRGGRSTAPPG